MKLSTKAPAKGLVYDVLIVQITESPFCNIGCFSHK